MPGDDLQPTNAAALAAVSTRREQQRAERRKRKERGRERRAQIAARYEERNREARERLEPLAPNERPTVVTVTALIAGAGTLFYFMVKAMARIQMPERRTPGGSR